jgi:hypothetical protein
MHDSTVALAAQPRPQTPRLPVGYMQPPGRFDLLEITFLDLLQNFQPLPFFRAQLDSLRSHPASQPG